MHAPLPLASKLAFVAIVPERNLATPEAGRALPETISRADVVFNLGRMGLLLAGLADPVYLVADATSDRIHQPARTALFPEAPALLHGLVEAGTLAASWSGARPTLLGIANVGSVEEVRSGAEAALAGHPACRGASCRCGRTGVAIVLRGRGQRSRSRSGVPITRWVERFAGWTAPCSRLIAALTLNVLSTWL